jgi:hypothetical protein
LITIAGALLALSATTAHEAATTHLDGIGRLVFSVAFVGAVVALLAVITICLRSLGPHVRSVPGTERLRGYGKNGTEISAVRKDAYKLYVAILDQLAPANRQRAKGVRVGLRALVVALVFAAAAAGSVYFATPWPTNKQTSQAPAPRPMGRAGTTESTTTHRVGETKVLPPRLRSGTLSYARRTMSRPVQLVTAAESKP